MMAQEGTEPQWLRWSRQLMAIAQNGLTYANSPYDVEPRVHQRLPRPGVFFEPMSKRRRGFPSEAQVKRSPRVVHGDKELVEKLGRNDLCPCGSGRRFKKCCLRGGRF